MVINRFGKTFRSDENGYIETEVKEEGEIFVAYGFVLVEEKPVEKPVVTKSK